LLSVLTLKNALAVSGLSIRARNMPAVIDAVLLSAGLARQVEEIRNKELG
jgi:hypothetical protein